MPLLTYTAMRIALVLGAGALLWVLGVRGWLLLVLSVVIGAGLSYVLLDGPRRAAANELQRRTGGEPTALERAVARDDDEEDAQVQRRSGPEGSIGPARHDPQAPRRAPEMPDDDA